MMKKISIVPALFLVFTACNNAEDVKTEKKVKYSDQVNEGLKGDIASIESSPYQTDSTGKAGAMDTCCISITEYDENGNRVKTVSKDSKGTVKFESVMTRYESGLWQGTKSMEEGKLTGSFLTTVDDKGNYTGATAYDSAGKLEMYYTAFTQNEHGQITGWKQWDKDSVFRMEGSSTYEKSLQTGFTSKDSVGKVKNSGISKYNDKGELIERTNTSVTKDTTETTVTKYTYESHDEMGNWTQRTTWNDKGKATRITKRTYSYRKKEEKK